jgi:hypothetical protein
MSNTDEVKKEKIVNGVEIKIDEHKIDEHKRVERKRVRVGRQRR